MSEDASVQAILKAKDELTPAARKAAENFAKASESIKSSLSSLNAKFTAMGGIATAAMGLVAGASAQKMLMIDRQAKQLGASLQQMQTIMVAARKGPEELAPALMRLNITLGSAKEGSKQAIEALKKVGLSLGDIRSMSSGDALEKIIINLGNIKDPAVRAAEALKIFGRYGVQAIAPLIAKGAGGLEDAQKKIKELGLGLTSEDLAKLKEAKGSLTLLKMATEAFGQKLAVSLAPAVKSLAENLSKLLGSFNNLSGGYIRAAAGAMAVAVAFSGSALVFGKVVSSVQTVIKAFSDLYQWIKRLTISQTILDAISSPMGWAKVAAGAALAATAVYALNKAFAELEKHHGPSIPTAPGTPGTPGTPGEPKPKEATITPGSEERGVLNNLKEEAERALADAKKNSQVVTGRHEEMTDTGTKTVVDVKIDTTKVKAAQKKLDDINRRITDLDGAIAVQTQVIPKITEGWDALRLGVWQASEEVKRQAKDLMKTPMDKFNESLTTSMAIGLKATNPAAYNKYVEQQQSSILGIGVGGGGQAAGLSQEYKELLAKKGQMSAEGFAEALENLRKKAGSLADPMEDLDKEFKSFQENLTATGMSKEGIDKQKALWAQSKMGAAKSPEEEEAELRRKSGIFGRMGLGFASQKAGEEADIKRRARLEEEAKREAGTYNDPYEGMRTSQERLASSMKEIQAKYEKGLYGEKGSFEANDMMRRAQIQAVQSYGVQPTQFQSHFEGIADTYKRIQSSQMSDKDTPEAKALKFAEANAGVVKGMGVSMDRFLQEAIKFFQGNSSTSEGRSPVMAG